MQTLKTLPFFAAVTDDELTALIPHIKAQTVKAGEDIIEPYSVTDGFWFLVQGNWRVTRKVAKQPQLMFESDRPGTWTGGIPVIDHVAPVWAHALTDCELVCVASSAVNQLVASNSQVAKRLLEAVNWGSGYIGSKL